MTIHQSVAFYLGVSYTKMEAHCDCMVGLFFSPFCVSHSVSHTVAPTSLIIHDITYFLPYMVLICFFPVANLLHDLKRYLWKAGTLTHVHTPPCSTWGLLLSPCSLGDTSQKPLPAVSLHQNSQPHDCCYGTGDAYRCDSLLCIHINLLRKTQRSVHPNLHSSNYICCTGWIVGMAIRKGPSQLPRSQVMYVTTPSIYPKYMIGELCIL